MELKSIQRKKYYSSNGARYYLDWIYSATPDEVLNNQKDLIILSTLDLEIQETIEMAVQNNLKIFR